MKPTERKRRKRSIPTEVSSLWGAFLVEGLLDALKTDNCDSHHSIQQRHTLEVMIAACQCLPTLWREVAPYWDSQVFDFPGPFESEVVSELESVFGERFRETGKTPTQTFVLRNIRNLVDGFVKDYEIVD